ncbi:hypothetical protein K2Z83_20730 [Oscillochloris sp. ZM17-4]|uniref:hypothetical protein n=1 Tax=Oscillochloris sp. ZM17-4 TaxID=2866714 RepID=UPI001C72D3B9|nr:hypothetical protein [Oscillochloris sp. ZM17-4]MBX0330097.1 hypothetical protein [Oscillochloris sp. ZM17-4]
MRATTTVVLNLGMGVESSAILVRWLFEPETRWFPLRKLIVLTAQVGDEGRRTHDLMEQVIYPLLRQHRIRTVQVARGGPSQNDGIVILDDTRDPTTCFTAGHYTLRQELLAAGTVPQYASGKRRCSLKFKGWPLDTWLDQALGKRRFVQVMGFAADEPERIAKDTSFATVQRATRYPLAEWGWERQRCEGYLLQITGERWEKSCCSYCPFAMSGSHLTVRFRADHQAAVDALLVEFVAMALNPRMSLFKSRTLRSDVERDGNTAALARFSAALDAHPWAVYRVRRVFYAPGVADRKVEALEVGDRASIDRTLHRYAGEASADIDVDGDFRRAHMTRRDPNSTTYPQVEHLLTIAPATVADKSRKRFDGAWAKATSPYIQQALI